MAVSFIISDTDQDQIGEENLSIIAATYGGFLAPVSAEVEVSLISKQAMQDLNRESRNIDEPTDVLSFPVFQDLETIRSQDPSIPALLGSIVICPEKALAYQETLPQLVHHGLLHICGFDHETDILAWCENEAHILESLKKAGLLIPPIPS